MLDFLLLDGCKTLHDKKEMDKNKTTQSLEEKIFIENY